MLKAGFARVDITPPLGMEVAGYYEKRVADGIIDPLLATAVAFNDGEKTGIVIAVDIIQMSQLATKGMREMIAKKLGIDSDAIFITASHIHTGPKVPGMTDTKYFDGTSAEDIFNATPYAKTLAEKLVDLSSLAVEDLAPAKMLYTYGDVKDVSFIRRYRMNDGTIRTNPGWQNPDIVEACDTPDEQSSLLIIKRESKKEIGIVNFQVHPDLIGRTRYTADYPKFVRDTYEANIPNSLCMYINGAQGDSNHIDVRRNPETDVCTKGYERAIYMGKKIAYSVLANYPIAKELKGDKIGYAQRDVLIKYNKGTPEEIPEALAIYKIYKEKGSDAAVPGGNAGMRRTQIIARVSRIANLMDKPDYTDLRVSALRVGEVIFGGLPGEPFTEIGRTFKREANYTFKIFSCLTNGGQGYYPTESALLEGGYEANSTSYAIGTAEKLVNNLIEIANEIKN